MSITKKIRINTDFLKIKGGRKKKKPKINHFIQPNKVKQKLIERIREHKKKNQFTGEKIKKKSTFGATFGETLDYLQNVVKERKTKRHRRKKRNPFTQPDDPPYGILKGGKKPLYSEYKKTLKKTLNTPLTINTPPISIHDNVKISPPSTIVIERQQKLQELRDKIRTPVKKIRKKRYTLGKRGGKIGIIIKSNKTRRKIKNEHKKLKRESIDTIKLYLKKHGLIKIGSNAPDKILRTIYETSILTGDVYNNNNSTLLHNFLNTEEKQYKQHLLTI